MAEHVSLTFQIMRSELAVRRQRMEADRAGKALLMAGEKLAATRTGVGYYFSTIDRRVLSVPVACMVRRSGVQIDLLLTDLSAPPTRAAFALQPLVRAAREGGPFRLRPRPRRSS
jgi:hypothetical protein